MRKPKTFLLTLVVMLLVLLASCIPAERSSSISSGQELPAQSATPGGEVEPQYESSASYIGIDDQEQILRSELIFLGRVQEISSTSWNQDSGEYWDSTDPANIAVAGDAGSFQVHQVRLECIQDLLADQCQKAEVVVTVISGSPIGDTGSSDYQLMIGDKVVVFLHQNEIGWREGGRKLVWYFAASPLQSLYIKGEDGLFHRDLFDRAAVSLEELQEAVQSVVNTPPVSQPPSPGTALPSSCKLPGWKSYENPNIGYSLCYPESWQSFKEWEAPAGVSPKEPQNIRSRLRLVSPDDAVVEVLLDVWDVSALQGSDFITWIEKTSTGGFLEAETVPVEFNASILGIPAVYGMDLSGPSKGNPVLVFTDEGYIFRFIMNYPIWEQGELFRNILESFELQDHSTGELILPEMVEPTVAPTSEPDPACSAVERLPIDSAEAQQIRVEFITHFKEQNPTEYMGLAILHRIDRLGEWAVIQGSVSGEGKDVIAVHLTPDGYQLADRYIITAPLASRLEPEQIIPQYFTEKLPDAPEALFTCLDQGWLLGQAPAAPSSSHPIAYVTTDDSTIDGVTQISIVQPDRSNLTVLLSKPMIIMDLAPSPDGTQIAFWGCPGKLSENCDPGENPDVWVIGRDGSNLRNLTDDSDESEMRPSWSPDGQSIAFESWRTGKGQIFIMIADGSGVRPLTYDSAFNSEPKWSPDGKWIAYHCKQDTGDFNEPTRTCVVSPQGEPAGEPIEGGSPAWSPVGPDGEARLAFRCRGEGGVNDICTAYPDGSDLVNLTNSLSREHDAVWSPDGEWIAYVAAQDGDVDIYKICAFCVDPRPIRLTDEPREAHWPAWSPDGTQILYEVSTDLLVVNADGSDAAYILSGIWTRPVWLP